MSDFVRHIIDPATGLALFVTPDDPSAAGLDAVMGSLANQAGGGVWWSKVGAAATAWSQLAATSGFLPLSGGSLNAGAGLTVPGAFNAQGLVTFSQRPTTGGVTYMLTGDSVPASLLTGATLPSNILASSLTSVGTLLNLTVTNTITGAISGNAGSATKLLTARAINGINFDGTAPITITAVTLSTPAQPNVTSLGALTGLTMNGALLLGTGTQGGPGTGAIKFGTGAPNSVRYEFGTDGTGWKFAVSKNQGGTITDLLTVRDDGLLTATGAALFSSTLTAQSALSVTGGQLSVTSPFAAGTYGVNIAGASGAATARDIMLVGMAGVSNGFTVQYNGSVMVYSMNNGSLTLPGGSVTATGFTGQSFAPTSQASFIAGSVHRRASEGLIVAGIAGSTNDFTLYSPSGFDVLTIPTGSNGLLAPRSLSVGAGIGNALLLSTQSATGSIATGSAVFTQGASGGNLNLAGRTDNGASGYGVIISYWNGSVWSAALDVRNASGASTLNLMPAGGNVNLGTAVLQLNGVAFASNVSGAHAYHHINTPEGAAGILLGGTADPSNVFFNTTHSFRNLGGTATFAQLDATQLVSNVPIYAITNGQAITARAVSAGSTIYLAFQNNVGTRRGYLGYGSTGAPAANLYLNNDEAGPIIFLANGGLQVASFSSTSAIFTSRVEMGGAMVNLNTALSGIAGLQFYNSGYTAWQQYMAPGGATSRGALGNLTAPNPSGTTGAYVTSWAMRSLVEPQAGYGWTWEAGAATGSYTPTVVMELTSSAWVSAGTVPMLKVWGDIMARRSATTGVVYFSDSISTYIYYNGSQFDFSGKPLTGIASLAITAGISAQSFTSTAAGGFVDTQNRKLHAVVFSTVAPTSSDTAYEDDTLWIVTVT